MKIKFKGVSLIILISILLLNGCGGDSGSLRHYDVTIMGHVEDFQSGNSVIGANIYIDSVLKDNTDSLGNFKFNCKTTRSFTLKISRTNYFTETLKISVSGDGEIIIPDIRLMDSYEFSGSISGNVMMGSISSILSNTNPYSDVEVMATIKEVTGDSITYWIVSDIVDVNSSGNYYIEHARINKPLTVIGLIDSNDNNTIDPDEFFGEHDTPTPLPFELEAGEHKENVNIFMTPESVSIQSTKNKKVVTLPKGE